MKKLLTLAVLAFFATTAFSQSNLFNAGVCHTAAAPAFNPGLKGCRLVLDTTSQTFYVWKIGTVWVALGRGVDEISGCSAPAYTPTKWQSSVVINHCTPNPELYYYFSGTWKLAGGAGGGATYTAGTGINISAGNVISNTGDLSPTNEIQNLSLAGQALSISSGTGVTLPIVGATAADFDLASGVLSLDYTNAQKATAVVPGFLTAADFAAFNAKLSTNVALGTGFTGGGGSGNIPDATEAKFNAALTTWGVGVTGKMIFNKVPYYESSAGNGFKYVGYEMRNPADGLYGHFGFKDESPGSINFFSFNENTSRYGSLSLSDQGVSFDGSKAVFAMNGLGADLDDMLSIVLLGPGRATIQDQRSSSGGTSYGLEYGSDISATLIANPLSLLDGTTVRKIYTAGTGISVIPSGNFQVISNTSLSLWTDGGATTYLTATTDNVAIGLTSATAVLHIKAGTATANTAPIKLTSGPLLAVSEGGAVGYNNSLYFTKNSGLRFGIGGIIFKSSTTVPNVTTAETDLYSHTLPASALATENESIEAAFSVSTLGSATATTQNRLYFGGTLIYDSGAIGFSIASDFRYTVEIIRESATVVKVSVTGATTTATAAPYVVYTRITGLTLTNTQVLRITGTRSGVGSASGDINGTMSAVKWFPAAG